MGPRIPCIDDINPMSTVILLELPLEYCRIVSLQSSRPVKRVTDNENPERIGIPLQRIISVVKPEPVSPLGIRPNPITEVGIILVEPFIEVWFQDNHEDFQQEKAEKGDYGGKHNEP